jgi:Protein of unknown function (DUF2855)
MGDPTIDFLVERDDLRSTRVATGPAAEEIELAPGQILAAIDRFGMTSNNITYAVVGDQLRYWQLFPAPPGWGRIPVWGYCDVVRSAVDGVVPGERFYGIHPMSSHAVLEPVQVGPGGFVDGASHRSALSPIYNRYQRAAADPGYERAREREILVFRPVFGTAFLLDDFLAERAFFGGRVVLLSSASSKLAGALAWFLRRRGGVDIVGLTSARHAEMVRGLGSFHRVETYDRLGAIAAALAGQAGRAPAPVYVDLAGDLALREAVHRQFADLRHSCIVGDTHWERGSLTDAGGLPGPAPTLFFAPAHIEKRASEWGPGALPRRLSAAWREFAPSLAGWLRVVDGRGPREVERVYRDLLEGRARPQDGHVLSLLPAPTPS